jgi:DNA-directed RNA polymerase subunit RPC12/RpoP
MAYRRYAQCPNESCSNTENGTTVSKCAQCGQEFCLKVTPGGNRGCAADGRCPHCGHAVSEERLLGYVYD